MTWRDVLDAEKLGVGTHITYAIEVTRKAHYKFFAFNGRVYDIHGEDTGILVSSLRG